MTSKKEIKGFTGILDIIKKMDNADEILESSKMCSIKDYIDTGNYLLNAAMTGSIMKGVPCGRVLTLSGDPGTGKTYLSLSICRNAQKKGYKVVYLDSEGAMDYDFAKRVGCKAGDENNSFILVPVTTISDVSKFVTNLTHSMLELEEDERDKVILVLDSLGNLTSTKELTDTMEGNGKRDMTKQQEIKALFRTSVTALSKLGIPFIVTSHIYKTNDYIQKTVVSGGSGIAYNGSLIINLTAAKLEDKNADEITKKKIGEFNKKGVLVSATPSKSRFTIPQKVKFTIPYFTAPNPYVGLDAYIGWDACGICRGKILSEKDYAKLSEDDKNKCHEWITDDGLQYVLEKETSRNYVVRHLGKEISPDVLFRKDVFTDDVLKELDEKVIRPNFELPENYKDEGMEVFDI